MTGSSITDNVPAYDVELSCCSKLLIVYQTQLLLHGWLPGADSVITNIVPGHGIVSQLSYQAANFLSSISAITGVASDTRNDTFEIKLLILSLLTTLI